MVVGVFLLKDTGKGMPHDELARLSEIIQRDSTALPGAQQYGLALLTDIVFHHGGTIEVDSAFNKGTEFRIVLPLGNAHFADIEIFEEPEQELMALEKEPSVQQAIADVALPENTKNVLVVEDNPDIRELIKDCLKDHYRVTEATDGKDALEKVNESAPDVIISDVLMPGMDGFDLCRTLKTDKALHHIPVVLLTAKSSDLMRIQGVEAGADAYIPKPFSPEQLIEKVNSLARERAES
jgi:two-component system sensor histidine kinase ChiS